MASLMLFAGNFAPKGWFFCDGTLLSTSQYSGLFSLIGTTYGGDGISNFALPDLRGRAPIHPGQGRGLSNKYYEGQMAGSESVTISQQQMPSHTHALQGVSTAANQSDPLNNYMSVLVDGVSFNPINTYNDGSDPVFALAALNPKSVSSSGGSQPVTTLSPVLAINYIICWNGIFPSRP